MPFRSLRLPCLLSLTLLTGLASTQQTPPSSTPGPAPAGATVLHTGTQLVIVDVVVQDKNGHIVRDLKPTDFTLTEDNTPQTVRHFEDHTGALVVQPVRPTPKLPAGTFTDYHPAPPSDVLNVLLVDTLNTPLKDQAYLQSQLRDFIRNAKPGAPTAIFGLTGRLILLQGFTSDPEILRDAIAHKLDARASNLLTDPTGLHADPSDNSQVNGDMISGGSTATSSLNAAAAFSQFIAMSNQVQLQSRIQVTLDCFNQLGHYLATLPGRKNVIWFSGAFPLSLVPSPILQEQDNIPVEEQTQFHETINLLARARVAVYPVDARGVQTNTVFDMAYPGSGSAASFSGDSQSFAANLASEHTTMRTIAEETGGKAFVNTNNLTKATALALESGSEFYSLTYTPTDQSENGKFRSIKVKLSDDAKAKGMVLAYRKGYYAPDAKNARDTVDTAEVTETGGRTTSYARAAMSFGAPQPSDIVFTARVLPASTTTETTVAKSNVLDPRKPITAPFRRFDIDLAAFPKDVRLLTLANGNRAGRLQFAAYLYDFDGHLLNTTAHSITYNLTPDEYQRFLHSPLNVHMEISAPANKQGFLRIGMQDVAANHMGAVEIPLSSVIDLPPPVYAAEAPSADSAIAKP